MMVTISVGSGRLLLNLSVLLVLFMAVDSESLFNITPGSMISTSPTQLSYWPSPSTNFSFGFYPSSLSDDQTTQHYIIGIWLARTCSKKLVWSLDRNAPPLPASPNLSILFDHDGLFFLNGTDARKPLLRWSLSSFPYARMQDNGNFAIYNNNSRIVWQSFDYPTDTLLANQTLKYGEDLLSSNSGRYQLLMGEDGYLQISDRLNKSTNYPGGNSSANYVSLNLNADGGLNFVDWDGIVIQNLGDTPECDMHGIEYRATMDSDGRFRLYGERECSSSKKSIVLWQSSDLETADDLKEYEDSTSNLWLYGAYNFVAFVVNVVLATVIYYLRKL